MAVTEDPKRVGAGRQNVLVILADEHARSAAGFSGHPIVSTPVLDRLAAGGTVFDRAYTPSPICIPARASIATGLPVFAHASWSSAESYTGRPEGWMHRLRDAGHSVVSVGKLHFRSDEDDHGFDEAIEPMFTANSGQGWPQGLLRRPMGTFPEAVELAALLGPGESECTAYDRSVADGACRWLREEAPGRQDPWALFVSFVSPHYPLVAPPEYFAAYADAPVPPPIPGHADHPVVEALRRFWCYDDHFDPAGREMAVRNYWGLCSFVDGLIGRVLDALGPGAADTLVLSTSDHGEMLGNHGFWCKSVMYEDAVAVPLIARGAGFAPGSRSVVPVTLCDLAATIEQAVLGVPDPASLRHGALPLQEVVADGGHHADRWALSEYHDGGSTTGIFMVRHGRWKLVHHADGCPDLLFDLEDDPDECHDLAGDPGHRGVCADLLARLRDRCDPVAVDARAFADQAEVLDRLGGEAAVKSMPSFNHTPIGS